MHHQQSASPAKHQLNTIPMRMRAGQAVLPVLFFLIIQLTLTLVIAFACGQGWLAEEEMSNVSTALAALIGFIVILFYDRKASVGALKKENWIPETLTPQSQDSAVRILRLAGILLLTVLLAVTVNCLLNGVVLMTGVQNIDPLYQKAAQNFADGSFALQVIAYGILVPIAEEALFRGIVYRFFCSRFNGSARRHASAILLTSLVFALYHGNLTQGVYTFMLSILLCLMTDRGGLILSVFLHMGVNLVSLAGEHFPIYVRLLSKPYDSLPLMAAMLMISCVIFFLLCKLTKHTENT